MIHQTGCPEEVFEQPADRFVAEFMGCTTFLPCEVAGPDRVCLLLDEEAPSVPCRLAPGATGRGVLGIRAGDACLTTDATGALVGKVAFRTYRGGAFELQVELGHHMIAVITTVPVTEGETVRLRLGRVHFFPESV